MNGSGEDAFPGAAFAADENRCVARRDLAGEIEHSLHGRVGALEVDFAAGLADDFFEAGHLLLQGPQTGNALDDQLYLHRREGLGEIVGRSALHRLDRVVDGAVGRDDDDAHPWALCQQLRDEVRSQIRRRDEDRRRPGRTADWRLRRRRRAALPTAVVEWPSTSRPIAKVLRIFTSSSTTRMFRD